MSNLKVSVGEALSTAKWNALVDRTGGDSAGFGAILASLKNVPVDVINGSGRDYDIGELMQIDGCDCPDGSNPYDLPGAIEYECITPVWHSKIDNIVVAAEPIPDGERGRAIVSGHCVIKTSGAATGRYAMINPSTPHEALVSSGGVARVLHQVSASYALCCLGMVADLWRYKLTEASQAPGVTTATLYTLDGTQFSTTEIELSDPLSVGDEDAIDYAGYCRQAGNEFHIQTGPC
ncbi:hypothetical protein [Roseiconus lacunae]|uniref:hypothetical protein n=1 Tax=Roseiconus lacunae TaxID=2605694 RepID=UPI001E36BEB2|nr:hypothetical protein [Roseiconus lacunae]MCD0460069.1 hypothetical protein [Roseiconus lacunae]